MVQYISVNKQSVKEVHCHCSAVICFDVRSPQWNLYNGAGSYGSGYIKQDDRLSIVSVIPY